uniref:Late endosomal/lysosomal adaptor and MAPK and MTOR activator 5 n=1 Tax=Acrobeloides nanus TaxID=290746 RepID=A0A914EHU0_9BILA
MLRHQQTVGAVVIDQEGRLAAATSTGHGEEFLRRAIAARVAFQYEFSPNPDISQICKNIVNIDMKDKLAGLITVDKNGNIGAETNAKMFYGSYKNGVITADIIGHQTYRFVYKLF